MIETTKIIVGVDVSGRPRRILNEIGRRYGRLVVLALRQPEPNERGMYRWLCKCDCGNETTVRGTSLRNGDTRSCGCYWNEIVAAGAHRLPQNEAAFHRVYGKIRDGARKRNLAWELTKDNVWSLISSTCFYCGKPPSKIFRNRYGYCAWNGVDQKEPCGGYTLNNCVTCCYVCNRMKLNIPFQEFLDICAQITLRQTLRTTKESHPQMRQVTIPLLAMFQARIPVLFEDIVPLTSQRDNLAKAR